MNLAAFAAGREATAARSAATASAARRPPLATQRPPPGRRAREHHGRHHDRVCFDPDGERLEPDALRALQLERLQRVGPRPARAALLTGELCREARVSRRTFADLDDLRRLPFLEKTTLRETYPDGLRICGLDDIIEVHSTSGTTGKPTPIWASRHRHGRVGRAQRALMWMVGMRPDDLLQNCFGYGLATSIGLQYGAQHAGIGVVPAGIGRQELLIDLIVDLGVTASARRRPTRCYLADKAQGARHRPGRDSSCASASSAPSPGPSRAATGSPRRWAWTRSTSTAWASSWDRAWPASVPVKDGMHVWSDHLLVECIDPETCEPVGRRRARRARLDVTDQRLDGDDPLPQPRHLLAHLGDRAPAAGRTPRIGRITGRSDDALSIGGLVVFPSQIEEVLVQLRRDRQQLLPGRRQRRQPRPADPAGRGRRARRVQRRGREIFAKKVIAATKATIGVTPRVEAGRTLLAAAHDERPGKDRLPSRRRQAREADQKASPHVSWPTAKEP